MQTHRSLPLTLLSACAIAFAAAASGVESTNPSASPATAPVSRAIATSAAAPSAAAPTSSAVGQLAARQGDEIVVAGRMFHTGAPVVLWTDPGGYDAYRTERRFGPWADASYEKTPHNGQTDGINSPARYGAREQVLSDAELEQVRGGGWPLELLQDKVDQFVVHYDVAGVSRTCFKVLHDMRGLSVQFMLDLDGTLYQTCDLKERAFHATKSNPRSVGIEIANMGAYRNVVPLKEWYAKDADGRTVITIPKRLEGGGIRDKSIVLRPDRDEMVVGQIRGVTYRQYDLTPQQYATLTKLVATLGTALPKITVDYPRGPDGKVNPETLTDEQWKAFTGVLGHWHVQQNKEDPGPAFQWDKVIDGARKLMSPEALARNEAQRGKAVQLRPGRGDGSKGTGAAGTQPTTGPTTQPGTGPTTQLATGPATRPTAARRGGRRSATRPADSQPAATKPATVQPATTQPSATRPVLGPTHDPALAARLWPVLHARDASGATIAARVVELETGRELYAERIDEPVIPASNLKLLTSAAALDKFGPDYPLTTVLALDGDDLWVIGTGDPSTGDAKMAAARGETPTTMFDRWAAALAAKGVKEIKGNLYYYDGAFDDEQVHPTWSRGYLTDWYAAPVAGLNFNDNCVDVTLRPAVGPGGKPADGQPALFDVMPPTTKLVTIENKTVTNGKGTPEIARRADADAYTLTGGVPATKPVESKAVTDPGAFFADALRANLTSHGIVIKGDTEQAAHPLGGPAGPPADKIVAVHATPMKDVLTRLNKASQNLFAEAMSKLLGRTAAVEAGDPSARGSWAGGSAAIHAFLKRVGVDESAYVIADGSGLSRANRVTARGHTDLLIAMSKHKYGEVFRDTLPIGGVDGTIGKRMKDIAGKVHAKTGYIGGVRALSGYAQTDGGKWLVFSMIYNNIPGGVAPYEAMQDDACRLLVAWPDVDKANLKPATRPASAATVPTTQP
jgi:N-acetylmuramoyl-L-alanine amidase